MPFLNELLRNDFLIRISGQTVASRQIHYCVFRSADLKRAIFLLYRLPRPVAHMLAGTRQLIKHGRLARIRLSQKRYRIHAPASVTSIFSQSFLFSARSVSRT